ncbi:MAG: ABC transporter substrate-binding protein [Actinobacteria bacterium]|nr:ABC transporter substrate-binding protein [Actinomycetota bacterium]
MNKRILTALLVTAALAGACADDSTDVATEPAGPAPTEAADLPQRIVSLSPTATEMLFAIGAGGQVVAVDEQSNFPPEAPTTDLSGFNPNLEAITTYQPDLVVLSGDRDGLVAGLETLGIETIVNEVAVTLDDTYDQIAGLAIATGHEDEGAEVVAGMRRDIDALVARVPERPEPLTYYHELDDTLYSVTSDTFIGQIYALAGLKSVADAADPTGEFGGYPQLSPELVVDADPDFIFLADTKCCGQSAETLAQRPGFETLSAVAEGRVVALDDDIASRWGPRVVDFLATVVEATATVPVA